MSLLHQWKCQDNAASTTVVAAVGTNVALVGGDNTSVLSVVDGPGTGFLRSLDLDGAADYIDFTALGIAFASGTAFSFACWFKLDNIGASRGIVGQTGSVNRCIIFNSTSFRVTGDTAGNLTFVVGEMTTGVWYHMLLTRTTGDSLRLFLDGVESSSGAQSLAKGFDPDLFGRSNTVYMHGPLCDARIYNSDESANVAAIIAASSSSLTADLSQIDENESATVAGTALVLCNLQKTEDNESGTIAATSTITASLIGTGNNDTGSLASTVAIIANLTATDDDDAGTIASIAIIGASLTATEDGDAGTLTAISVISAAISLTDDTEQAVIEGGTGTGSLTATDDNESGTLTGTVSIIANLSATDGAELALITVSVRGFNRVETESLISRRVETESRIYRRVET